MISCYKDAYKVDADFVGGWTSLDGLHTIEIPDSKRDGAYYNQSGGSIVGRIRSNGTNLKIGGKKFSIDQLPRKDSITSENRSVYSMILDGDVYITRKFE